MTDDRIHALMRLLTSEGHITPVGAHQVTQVWDAHDAEVAWKAKAEALREAATDAGRIFDTHRPALYHWLHDRADRIEREAIRRPAWRATESTGSQFVTHVGPEEYVAPSDALRTLAVEHGINQETDDA